MPMGQKEPSCQPFHYSATSFRQLLCPSGWVVKLQVQAVQPVLHKIKGFGSPIVGVVGRTLPTIESCTFPLLVVVVARRYELKMDPHTKQ